MKFLKILSYIFAGIGVLVVLIIALAFWGSSGVDKVAEAVMAEFKAGNIREVYDNSLMTNDFTFEEFSIAMGIDDIYDISKAEKIKWLGRGFENEEKYIYGTFKFSNGVEETLTFWFVEVDDELKLLGITGGEPDDYEE